MIKLILISALLSWATCDRILFSWDLGALKRLRNLNKQERIEPRSLSASLLKLWVESNKDLVRLAAENFPSVYDKASTVYGTGGDKSFYSSVVPYAFPCNSKPLGCKDYSGNQYNGTCTEDGLPWVICDGYVRCSTSLYIYNDFLTFLS